jgi:hypothetical protein
MDHKFNKKVVIAYNIVTYFIIISRRFLNLMATEAIAARKGLTELITEVKETVSFFKQSVKAADRLKAEQLKTRSECLKLKQEVKLVGTQRTICWIDFLHYIALLFRFSPD